MMRNQVRGDVTCCCPTMRRQVVLLMMWMRRCRRLVRPPPGCGLAQALMAGGTVRRVA
jgi:hypothetical protein